MKHWPFHKIYQKIIAHICECMFIVEPQAPTFQAIQDADVTEDAITVRWNAPASGADTYELKYEITSQGSSSGNTFTGLTTTCRYHYCQHTNKQLKMPIIFSFFYLTNCFFLWTISKSNRWFISWSGIHIQTRGCETWGTKRRSNGWLKYE